MVSQAVTTIKDGAKYRITCQRYDNGCVVLGEKHDAAAFLYYATNLEAVPEDAWWVLCQGRGFHDEECRDGTVYGVQKREADERHRTIHS